MRLGFDTNAAKTPPDGTIDQPLTDAAAPQDFQPQRDSRVEDVKTEESAQPLDSAPPLDAAQADVAADTSKPDTSVPDAKQPDTSVPDANVKVPDASKPDTSVPDVTPPDAVVAPDKPLPSDSPSTITACDPTAGTYFQTLGTNMVVCKSTGAYVTQCQASTLCNNTAGWHLCTASEFHARGGQTKQASTSAWIAGCYTSKTKASTPSDLNGICTGGCKAEPMGSSWPAYWYCSGATPVNSVRQHMALRTGNVPRRVATNTQAFCAIWVGVFTYNTHPAALCCK